jgi:hypothetical protein
MKGKRHTGSREKGKRTNKEVKQVSGRSTKYRAVSGVFQNIDPPTPSPPVECVPPRLWCGGRTHSLGGERVGGQYFGRRQT